MSPKLLEQAYQAWRRQYSHRAADEAIDPFLAAEIHQSPGWLLRAREALLLSGGEVAKRLGISRSAYAMLEKNESTGAITLQSLAKAAEAMECELVYAIRPRAKARFSKLIWEKLLPLAAEHANVKTSPDAQKPRILAGIAKTKMDDPKVRQSLHWSKRH